jgi:hypothetical protein
MYWVSMSEPFHVITCDINHLSLGLGLSESVTSDYFKDGRRGGPLVENRIIADLGVTKAPSEGSPFDYEDADGLKFEVRAVTSQGVSFAPSNQTGAGRSFNETGFLNKLSMVDGYVFADLTKFPEVPCFKVSTELAHALYNEGLLGKNAKLSSPKRFYDVVVSRL